MVGWGKEEEWEEGRGKVRPKRKSGKDTMF